MIISIVSFTNLILHWTAILMKDFSIKVVKTHKSVFEKLIEKKQMNIKRRIYH